MAQDEGNSSIWDNSPYTMFLDDNDDNAEDAEQEGDDSGDDVIFKRRMVDLSQQLENNNLPPVILSGPPPGYYTEFNAETSVGKAQSQFSEEERSLLSDTSTAFGQAAMLVTMDSANSLRNKEVRQQSRLGAKFMDTVTKVPLSDFWHGTTKVFAVVIFGTNVASAGYDISDLKNLHYKVPNILFGIVATVLLFAWFNARRIMKSSDTDDEAKKKEKSEEKKDKKREENERKKKEKEDDKWKKKQQYIENILHEALLYPIIVLSVFGFANDKMYDIKTDWFSLLQLVLIIIDALDVLWTQIMRIYMIHTFLKEIKSALKDNEVNIGFKIFLRCFITTICNFVLFIFLILLLGAQVHNDNFNNPDEEKGYHGSINSLFLIIAVVTLPLFNLIIFVAVNYHWVVELLLTLGDKDNTKKSFKQTGLANVLKDAADLAHASKGIKKKLESMRSVPEVKRFISVATEPVIAAMILLWETILVLAIYYFDGCEHTLGCRDEVVQTFFVLIAIGANIHAVIVAILFNVGIVVAIAALLFYPVSVPLLLRKGSDEI